MNAENFNIKYVLLGVGALVAAIGLVAVVLQRQNSNAASSTAAPTTLGLPGSIPGRASGYKGAELMPAPPGASGNAGAAPIGHATGYQNANLMPAPPARQ